VPIRILWLAVLAGFSAVEAEVVVSSDTMAMPTWLEGPANPNPPFDQLNPSWAPSFYPYTWRTSFTEKKLDHSWRVHYLENEYLKCIFLPDLGGRLYTCLDKINGRDMFYANPSVKKAYIGLRGAGAALGIEFNFPVGHSWVTVSPVDSAVRQNPDGSATVVISSVDRVTGMQWRVDSTLRPRIDLLEQKVTLYNPSSVRHSYYWWSTAAVPVDDDSTTFIMPAALSATHDFTEVDTWPVNSAGVNVSVVGNHKAQTAVFAHGSQEPFLAIYQPKSRSGTIHYADVADVSGKKIWSWGHDPNNGNAWVRKYLSDNGTTFAEIQGGLFKDQETFEFLEPQQIRSFTEYWMPARNLGGVSRANLSAAVNLQRSKEKDGKIDLTFEVQVYRPTPSAVLRILNGDSVLQTEIVDLDPAVNVSRALSGLPASDRFRLEIADRSGKILLAHSEGSYNALTPQDFKIGKLPAVDYNVLASEGDFLKAGDYYERISKLDAAAADYNRGLTMFPASAALWKAAGRMSVVLKRFAEGAQRLQQAQGKAASDAETHYYLGLAYAQLGDDAKARAEWSAASASPFSRAAGIQTAAALSRAGDWAGALQTLRAATGDAAGQTRAGAMEVAFLRHLERRDEATSRLAFWQSADPSDLFLQFERFRLGSEDPAFFRQLAADPDRVLNVTAHLFELGLYEDSLTLTDRTYAPVDPLDTEPGAVLPQNHPLVAYYRAYARERLGQLAAAEDYRTASRLSILYIFPSRPGSVTVLEAALKQNPNDATAHALLGSLYFNFRMTDEAIAEWQKARAIRKDLPALHRNLGRALLEIKMNVPAAVEVLAEGLRVEPKNDEIAQALQKAKTQSPAPAVRRK
jgi:tetratricopeptide (TPR) repeat protein